MANINTAFILPFLKNREIVLQSCRSIKRWVSPTLKTLKARQRKMDAPPPQHRSTYLEWNYHSEIYAFGKRIKENIDSKLLQQVFITHSYIAQEEAKLSELNVEDPKFELRDNEVLISEGNKFMHEYIQPFMRKILPRLPEEGIIAISNFLTSDETLALVSKSIGTTDLILCPEFPVEQETLSKVLSALVGAIVISSGKIQAGLFVRDFIISQLSGKDVNDIWQPEKPFQTLQEILEREGREKPEPRLIGTGAAETIFATYNVAVYSNRCFLGSGFGENVSTAVEMAALDALKRMFHTSENMRPISYKFNISGQLLKEPTKNIDLQSWTSDKVKNIVNC